MNSLCFPVPKKYKNKRKDKRNYMPNVGMIYWIIVTTIVSVLSGWVKIVAFSALEVIKITGIVKSKLLMMNGI